MKATPPTPPLTIEDTGIIRGRQHIRATYASKRAGESPHTTEGRDDGTIIGCCCPGYRSTGHCWHGTHLALDWFAARWADATLPALAVRDASLRHYLSLGPERAEEDAARIELTAIGDIIGARLAESEAA